MTFPVWGRGYSQVNLKIYIFVIIAIFANEKADDISVCYCFIGCLILRRSPFAPHSAEYGVAGYCRFAGQPGNIYRGKGCGIARETG